MKWTACVNVFGMGDWQSVCAHVCFVRMCVGACGRVPDGMCPRPRCVPRRPPRCGFECVCAYICLISSVCMPLCVCGRNISNISSDRTKAPVVPTAPGPELHTLHNRHDALQTSADARGGGEDRCTTAPRLGFLKTPPPLGWGRASRSGASQQPSSIAGPPFPFSTSVPREGFKKTRWGEGRVGSQQPFPSQQPFLSPKRQTPPRGGGRQKGSLLCVGPLAPPPLGRSLDGGVGKLPLGPGLPNFSCNFHRILSLGKSPGEPIWPYLSCQGDEVPKKGAKKNQ